MIRFLWFTVGLCVGLAVTRPDSAAAPYWAAALGLWAVGACWTVRQAVRGTGGLR